MVDEAVEKIMDIPDPDIRELVEKAFDVIGEKFDLTDYQRCLDKMIRDKGRIRYQVLDEMVPAKREKIGGVNTSSILLNKCILWDYPQEPLTIATILAHELLAILNMPDSKANPYIQERCFPLNLLRKVKEAVFRNRTRHPHDIPGKRETQDRPKCSDCKYEATCREKRL